MDHRIEELAATIQQLLAQRADGATICPSEAARAVEPNHWQPMMDLTRQAARRLVAQGDIEIVQGDRVVDPDSFKGPIRLRRRKAAT